MSKLIRGIYFCRSIASISFSGDHISRRSRGVVLIIITLRANMVPSNECNRAVSISRQEVIALTGCKSLNYLFIPKHFLQWEPTGGKTRKTRVNKGKVQEVDGILTIGLLTNEEGFMICTVYLM